MVAAARRTESAFLVASKWGIKTCPQNLSLVKKRQRIIKSFINAGDGRKAKTRLADWEWSVCQFLGLIFGTCAVTCACLLFFSLDSFIPLFGYFGVLTARGKCNFASYTK